MMMTEADNIVILITSPSSEEAQGIAELLLSQRQAACVNIISGVESRFWWQGKLESAKESLLIIKTKASQLEEIVIAVKQVHSYAVPEIIALPVVGGNADYLDWIQNEVKDGK